MKKRSYLIIFILILISIFIFFDKEEKDTLKQVKYNGDRLLVSIDGVTSNTLPNNGTYYLTSYDCKNKNTKLSWDIENNKLNVTNGISKADVACYLEFESNPKLSEMSVGSYVEYIGVGGNVGNTSVKCQTNGSSSSSVETAETESPNSCLGQNAREDIDENGNTYGYCDDDAHKYYTTGWRIAYIDSNNKPMVVSAGSPECNSRTSSRANTTYIKTANTKAMKYCNLDYVDGDCGCLDADSDGYCDCTDSDADGLCDEIANGDLDAWAINDIDFYNMTKAISGVGKRLSITSSSFGDKGGTLGTTLYCYNAYSREECGYNNDLIDNGGYYWFAAQYSSTYTGGVDWIPSNRYIGNHSNTEAYGLRPIISLSETVVVTGGKGTMDDPYEIANNKVSVSTVNTMDESGEVNYILDLMAAPSVTQMCVNVNSSGCSNYVEFDDTYLLDSSRFNDGENIVYVYYKNSVGGLVASLNKSFNYEKID